MARGRSGAVSWLLYESELSFQVLLTLALLYAGVGFVSEPGAARLTPKPKEILSRRRKT